MLGITGASLYITSRLLQWNRTKLSFHQILTSHNRMVLSHMSAKLHTLDDGPFLPLTDKDAASALFSVPHGRLN